MDSRIREGQNKLIDAFAFLIRGKTGNPIVWCYPENGLSEELRHNVAKFAFPFHDNFKSSNIDYFTFVLTDIDGKFKFGFCRMSAGSESTLCLISSYPWFEIFYKILNHLSDAHNSTNGDLQKLLEQLWNADPSGPGKKSLTYTALGSQFTIHYPDADKLPSIPESRNLTEYYNAIDGNNMLVIFASMLFERRIIVTSRKLSRLTACVYGATSLIYPLNWQHIFIPVLPYHLIDYISAPMPYLIGVHSSVFEIVKPSEIGDAVIVDADARKVTVSHGDLASLPIAVVNSLRKDLNLHRNDNHCSLTGDKLPRAFLKAMVSLIGGYRMALVLEGGGKLGFDSDIFLHSHPSNMQKFLQTILQSQSFEQFIAERLSLSRYSKGFSDIFEDAILDVEAKSKQGKGSVKNKMNQIIQEKVLTDIRKKVKSTSVKTLSSVKKKLDFKKSEDGKTLPAKKDDTDQSKTLIEMTSLQSAETKIDDDVVSRMKLTPSDLQTQSSDTRTSATQSRDDSWESLETLRQRSNSDFATELDRASLFKKYSFDDLEISNLALEHDIVNLSNASLGSSHDFNGSKSEQTPSDIHDRDNSVLINDNQKEQNPTDIIHINGANSNGLAIADEESVKGPIDRDSVNKIPTINKTEIAVKNPDLLQAFPSVRQLRRALQTSSPVKRKAVVSVRELPSVRQMVQKLEASSTKPKEVKFDASQLELGTSYVAHHAAMYSSLDRKARSSLARKPAIRALGQKPKISGDEDKVNGISPLSEKRPSFMAAKSERYQGSICSEKNERNYVSPDLTSDPQPGFGCLLRVSSRSASMRQFDMEQRQFSCIKRKSPPSDRSKKDLKESRKAIYDFETEIAAEEVSPAARTALYVPDKNVLSNKTDSDDGAFDLPKSEVIVNLSLSRDATDGLFVSESSVVTSGNCDTSFISSELDSPGEPVEDQETSELSKNRVSMHFPINDYSTLNPVSFTFKLTACGSCEEPRDRSAVCNPNDKTHRPEAEPVPGDDACVNYNSITDALERELSSRVTASVPASQPLYENARDEDYTHESCVLLESVTVDEVLRHSTKSELQNVSHQPPSVGQIEESSNLLYEGWAESSVHETSESSDENSR